MINKIDEILNNIITVSNQLELNGEDPKTVSDAIGSLESIYNKLDSFQNDLIHLRDMF